MNRRNKMVLGILAGICIGVFGFFKAIIIFIKDILVSISDKLKVIFDLAKRDDEISHNIKSHFNKKKHFLKLNNEL